MKNTHKEDMSLREAIDTHNELQKDLQRIQKRIFEYKQTAYSVASPSRYDGMPKAQNNNTSRTERIILRLAELEEAATNIQADIMQCQRILYEQISEIPDSHIRIMFKARFIDGLSWYSIGRFINDGNDEESQRKAVYRYLKEYGGNNAD